MALSNLFTGLPSFDGNARGQNRSDVPFGNKSQDGRRGKKRKTHAEHPDSFMKRRCHQAQTKHASGQWQEKDPGRPGSKPGSHTKKPKKKRKQKQQVWTRFMSQEFKEQNGLVVEGRLVCRHFLLGRCVKAADCQLEHVPAQNDQIREVCKFYIQGACSKGGGCPYMHQSFPCKFFHRGRKCRQGEACRFSHRPLSEVTGPLLEEFLKWENEQLQLSKRAEEGPAPPMKTGGGPEAAPPTLRPSFYNYSHSERVEPEPPPTDSAPPPDPTAPPPQTPPRRQEPVCYSVEAVLGPQLSGPFPRFYAPVGPPPPPPKGGGGGAEQRLSAFKECVFSESAHFRQTHVCGSPKEETRTGRRGEPAPARAGTVALICVRGP